MPKIKRMPLKTALIHGLDPFGTNMKLILISLVFPSDQVDPVWIRSALSGTICRSTYEGDPIWNYIVQV